MAGAALVTVAAGASRGPLQPAAALAYGAATLALAGTAAALAGRAGRRRGAEAARADAGRGTAGTAERDALTGALNRTAFLDRLRPAPEGGARHALFLIDLDRFKAINDTHGHAMGDAVLAHAGATLRAAFPEGAIGRLGGDEFAVVEPGLGSAAACQGRAERLLRILSEPVMLHGRLMQVRASIGVAWAPEHGRDETELMRCADLALYRAKAQGRGVVSCFDAELLRQQQRQGVIVQGLKDALAGRSGLEVHYQPILGRDRAVVAVEALLRWTHPELGPVSPAEFIPLAEETGLVHALGRFVLERAMEDGRGWDGITLNVNVSPVQLRGGVFVSVLRDMLRARGFDPRRLMLEITEGVLLECGPEHRAELKQLRELGVRLSLDDFGSGHSNLSYLRDFALDEVKIDKSYVRDLRDSRKRVLLTGITSLARALNLLVVAEGVETEEQFELLRIVGCSLYQGYLFAKPMPAAAFEARFLPGGRGAAGLRLTGLRPAAKKPARCTGDDVACAAGSATAPGRPHGPPSRRESAVAMSRLEFEKAFSNPENRLFRRAHIMHALANGTDWRQWATAGRQQTVPAYYNDLTFVACYMLFRNVPTRHRMMTMRDFLWARGPSDSAFLIDPVHQQSDARKQAVQAALVCSQEQIKAEKEAGRGGVNDPQAQIVAPDGQYNNVLTAVYSEMWVPGGSMRAYIGQAPDLAIMQLGANVAKVKSDTNMTFWLDTMVNRFSGSTTLSARYGTTFDTSFLGLTGSDSAPVIGRSRARPVIGGNRG